MLNMLAFLYNLIDQHVIWLYAACLLVIAFQVRSYLIAHRDRVNTIFTIEKEVAAHREGRAMSAIGTVLAVVAIITGLKFYVAPTIDVTSLVEPTPTLTLAMPTREPATPTPTPTMATATPHPSPTRMESAKTPTALSIPTATPQPAPAACADPNVRIISPGANASVSGRVTIRGTANHGQIHFYNVAYSQGEDPSHWIVVHTIQRSPVLGGQLEELDTTALPNGVYWLQLTVVDQTGNFPPPCRVRIVIQN